VTGPLLGLVLGAGLFCIWWSCWPRTVGQGHSGRVRLADRLRDDLVQSGAGSLTVGQLILVCMVVGAAASVLVLALTRVLPVALAFGLITGYGPLALVRARARRRRASMRDVWPDVVDNIASAVRAGLALPESLSQLAERGPEELRPMFAEFARDYRATGRFHDCLDRLKDRLSDPVGDRLVESLRIAREVGGSDLGRLLRTLSRFLREDARSRAELEARQSWTVGAARLALAAPWIVLGMLATRGTSIGAYDSTAGGLILVVGGVVSVVAYRLMLRIGRLPEEGRVLR
jgi:tight adherence protein B